MANEGKRFQNDFRKSAEKVSNLTIERLYGTMPGFAGINNPCDFILYYYPNIYYLELKSHLGNRLPLEAIRQNQYEGLIKRSYIKGAICGFVIQFRDFNETYFIHIKDVEDLINQGKKSISIQDCREKGILVPGNKKRVTWEYDIKEMINLLKKKYGGDINE